MNVLLVEDDRKLSASVTVHLEADKLEVQHCHDGRDGLEYALSNAYDLVILDVMLPTLDGFEVLRRVRAAGLVVPILMLTARNTVEDKVNGLDGGADDYLAKPFHTRELMARVRALLRRSGNLHDDAYSTVWRDLSLDASERRLTGPVGAVPLTKKECTILELLLRNPTAVVGREAIFLKAWPDSSAYDSNLDAYIYLIRKKLARVSEHAGIRTVPQAGYAMSWREEEM